MNIYLSLVGEKKIDIKTEFFPETAVKVDDLYLLMYDLNKGHYIIKDEGEPDIRTDNFAEFHLTKLHHVLYGYFFYNEKKISAQIGCYIRRTGKWGGFVPVLLSHDFEDKLRFVAGYSEAVESDSEFIIIDLDDFNKIRNLIGLKEFTLQEYIAKRVHETVSEYGLTLNQETSLFSINNKFDVSNLMTIRGMDIFLEEQSKKEI